MNNDKFYNAALAGALAGLTSRWLTSINTTDYDSQTALCASFATAFDAAIPPGAPTSCQADLVESICNAFWTDRMVTADADLAQAATSLAAVYTSASSLLQPCPGAGPAPTLSPLKNTFWLDAQSLSPTGPGLPLIASATSAAFPSLVDALSAFDVSDNHGRFLCIQGDYTNGGVAVSLAAAGCQQASFEGIGGSAFQVSEPVFLPPLIDAAPGPGGTIATLVAHNVMITADGTGAAIFRPQNVLLWECFIQGTTEADNSVVATQCTFQGGITAGQQCQFLQCDVAAGYQFALNNSAAIDLASFINFGSRGVTRTDGANDAIWRLSTPSPAVQQIYAALQDADRTVNIPGWEVSGAWVPRGSFTAPHVLTVTMAAAPALALFEVWNFGQFGNALTVNGTVVADFTHVTFQNVGGVLTAIALEILV